MHLPARAAQRPVYPRTLTRLVSLTITVVFRDIQTGSIVRFDWLKTSAKLGAYKMCPFDKEGVVIRTGACDKAQLLPFCREVPPCMLLLWHPNAPNFCKDLSTIPQRDAQRPALARRCKRCHRCRCRPAASSGSSATTTNSSAPSTSGACAVTPSGAAKSQHEQQQ
jgi:hypothetical protein